MFFGRKQKLQLNNAEVTYKVHYLGNVMTTLVKGGYHHGNKKSTTNSSAFDSTGSGLPGFEENESRFLNISDSINQPISVRKSTEDDQMESSLNKKFSNIVCNVDKPVRILWENHLKHNGHAGLKMKMTLTQGGLRVNTKDHGLTEYYGHRIHFITAHHMHPKLFVWVYQHVGKNLKSEIRCHAVLCERTRDARLIEKLLTIRLHQTFMEYKREKRRQQNSRLCNTKNGGLLAGQVGTRKRTFTKSTKNYKPPVQHGMCSAPKLDDVLEEVEEEEEEEFCATRVDNKSECCETVYDNIQEVKESDIEPEMDQEPEKCLQIFDEDDFNYQSILAQINKDKNLENDVQLSNYQNTTINLLYQEDTLKLPLSSSSSSSLTSSECQHPPETASPQSTQSAVSSSSPIFISSCSAASSISSSSSEPTISPNSITSEKYDSMPAIESPKTLHTLANDSGVCTSASSVLSAEIAKFKNHLTTATKTSEENSKFNQVSYEFFDDLSQRSGPPIKPIYMNAGRFRGKMMPQSRSFNAKVFTAVVDRKTRQTSEEGVNEESSNPFLRSKVSRSFSAFTSRLKQQQQIKKINTDSQKCVTKTLKFNELVVEIESETDKLTLNSPRLKNHNKKMAPPPPTSTTTSFIKCYTHTPQSKKSEFFYVNNKATCNVTSSGGQMNGRSNKKLVSNCSNSPISSPELSTCSDVSTYSRHSDDAKTEDDCAQYIISL